MEKIKREGCEMITDLIFRQIQELRKNITSLEISISEINNAIFLLEEHMYDIDDRKAALHEFEDAY